MGAGRPVHKVIVVFVCLVFIRKIAVEDAPAHRHVLKRAPLWQPPCSRNTVNIKYLSIAGVLLVAIFLAGWGYFRVDMDSMRASYAISPEAVIMFSRANCGSTCTDQAKMIQSRGLEVVSLDIDDGTAGSHLWQALEGGNGPFPAFLVAGADHLQTTDGGKTLKLADPAN